MPAKFSEKKPGEKLLSLYTIFMLKGAKHTSLGDLAQALDCSKQTVLRLLDQLEASGYGKLEPPVKKGKEHLYRMQKAPTNLDMGVTELAQLALCRNLLLSLAPEGMSKIMGAEAENQDQVPNSGLSLIYTKGRIDYEPFQDQYSKLLQGLRARRVCFLEYKKHPAQEARSFHFAPLRLISYHESIAFLGWEVSDSGKTAIKFPNPLYLYLQRCRQVRLTQRSAAKLPLPDEVLNSRRDFGVMRGESFGVVLLFESSAAAYVHDRQWSPDQKMRIMEDGRLLLEFKARSRPEVISWVLSFGKNVRALEPAWLRDELATQAWELLKLYKPGEARE